MDHTSIIVKCGCDFDLAKANTAFEQAGLPTMSPLMFAYQSGLISMARKNSPEDFRGEMQKIMNTPEPIKNGSVSTCGGCGGGTVR